MNQKNNRSHARKFQLGLAALGSVCATPLFALPQAFTAGGTAQPPPLLLPKTIVSTNEATTLPATNAVAAPAANPVEKFFDGKIPDAIAAGKFNLNVRLRYEQADEEGVPAINKNSYAPTIRTRFGYTTASLYGFDAMVEGVNVSVIGPEHNYNAAASNGQTTRPSVGDPPLSRVDQAWLGYNYTNWVKAKVGEQQINLDNQRFVGDSGWRQNFQTFNAAAIGSEPIKDLNLYYGYLWYVHRVYGNVDGLAPANTDFHSDSHLFNVSYSGWKYGRFVAYTYLLDLHNSAGNTASSATYGGYFAGAAPVCDRVAVDYRAEFAWQNNYAESPLHYGAEYYNFEGGVSMNPVAVGAGFENLGSSANTGTGPARTGFSTPLQTVHPFNGWANIFQTTPADGLQDLYAYAQVTLPAQIPVKFVYHKFDAAYGGADYGQEFDVMVSKKFGKHWNALAEYAGYQGKDSAAPVIANSEVAMQRFWAQVEFNF